MQSPLESELNLKFKIIKKIALRLANLFFLSLGIEVFAFMIFSGYRNLLVLCLITLALMVVVLLTTLSLGYYRYYLGLDLFNKQKILSKENEDKI